MILLRMNDVDGSAARLSEREVIRLKRRIRDVAWNPKTGADLGSFPKVMQGLSLIGGGPAVGDVNGDGRIEISVATREGYVHLIETAGTPAGVQWGAWQGDPQHTGTATGSP